MQTTANYGLKKPEGTDVVDIQNFNDNADTIDAELKKRVTTSDYIRSPGYVVDTGTANAYVVTLNPAPTAYADGMAVTVKIKTTNTGASTLNINGLGAKTILDSHGNALAAGKLKAGLPYTFRYNGTNFILQGEGGEYGTATQADVLNTATFGTEQGVKQGTMNLTNLTPGNVKKNVNINGVIGTVEEKLNIQDCLLNIMQNTSIQTLECFIKNEGLWCKDDTNTLCLYDINSNLVKTISPSILINVVTGDYKITAAYFLYLDEQYIIWNITCNSVSSSGTYYFILLTDKRANIIHRYSVGGTSAAGACISNNKIYIFYDYGGTKVSIDGYDILTGNSIASFNINSITNLGLHSIYNVYYFNNLGTKILLNCICSDGDDYYSIVICIDTVNNVIVFNNKFKGAESSTYLLLNKLCASTFF